MQRAEGSPKPEGSDDDPNTLAARFLALENELTTRLDQLHIDAPVAVVYSPLIYAHETHECYVRASLGTFGQPKVVFLGLNAGPFGMAQNGVPFGDTKHIRDWLGVRGDVHRPAREHPRRPVHGIQCTRSEQSGKRFWGLMKELCGGDVNRFLQSCYVHNFCPLSFMMENGRNITPDQLRVEDRNRLQGLCDESLRDVLTLLRPELVVGIGKYASERAQNAVSRLGFANDIRARRITHPSPANASANRLGWRRLALRQLFEAGFLKLMDWPISEDLLQEAAQESNEQQ